MIYKIANKLIKENNQMKITIFAYSIMFTVIFSAIGISKLSILMPINFGSMFLFFSGIIIFSEILYQLNDCEKDITISKVIMLIIDSLYCSFFIILSGLFFVFLVRWIMLMDFGSFINITFYILWGIFAILIIIYIIAHWLLWKRWSLLK